jgi:hypothetical protein
MSSLDSHKEQDFPKDEAKKAKIRSFNEEARASPHFAQRRRVLTTGTIFPSDGGHETHKYRTSLLSWCSISSDLEEFLVSSKETQPVIRFTEKNERKWLRDTEFQRKSKEESQEYLKTLAKLYVDRCIETYEKEKEAPNKEKLLKLAEEIERSQDLINSHPSIILYIKEQSKKPKEEDKKPISPCPLLFARKRSPEEVLQFKEEGKYSVRDICTLCKTSTDTYYKICKRKKLADEGKEIAKEVPLVKTFLRGEELMFIKKLADNPQRSYTVPEMCEELRKK